ncbi:LysR substrate-binding domain-containing protein [Tropicimonas sp. IMCC34043]|uniref:LysR substrate-binding domain-containing protein n=1 Tax=Tropicimonas sp. IMCC34043 TaxID=2248760 RepID=UPI000E2560DD|nr:LysR substrate-binding domain-containing protein [Tropicimonas sp. IMCC34043]
MRKDLNLNGMKFFESVARLGRVSMAAEELGVSPSAVSQQIRLLEQQFGVHLFRRNNRRLALTEDGERLYQATGQALRMVNEVYSAIVRQQEHRRFNLRVSPSFGVRWLGPRIKQFLDQNPNWDLRVDATPDFTDFETEVVDADVRYGAGGWSGLHEQNVLHDFVLPLCSPEYLETLKAHGSDPMEHLRKARLIDSVKTHYRWDLWLARYGARGEDMSYQLRFDRSSMAIQLARDGAGVVLESATLAWKEILAGELVPLSNEFQVIEFPAYWVVCPPRHTHRRIVRIFIDWIGTTGRDHDTAVRDRLIAMGCTIAREDGPTLGAPARPDGTGGAGQYNVSAGT